MIRDLLMKTNATHMQGLGIAVVVCFAAVLVGCHDAKGVTSLPPEQAAAVETLRSLRAQVHIRDGVVTFVDFYGTRDTAEAVGHLKAFKRLKKLNFGSTRVTDGELKDIAHLSELEEKRHH